MIYVDNHNVIYDCFKTSVKPQIKNIAYMLFSVFVYSNKVLALDLTVTNHNANGSGSLLEAIAQTHYIVGPHTIRFDENHFSQARVIQPTATLLIQGDIQIIGPGKNLLTIQASAGIGRDLFTIDPKYFDGRTGHIEIENMTLAVDNTQYVSKRLVYVTEHDLTISNVNLIGNGEVFDASGAAIAIVNGNLTLKNCKIEHFVSEFRGGAIFTDLLEDFYIEIDNCALLNNSVVGDINNANYPVSGGAIYVLDRNFSSHMLIKNSEISYNSSVGNGGGMALVYLSTDIINSTISNNSTGESGGGIYITNGTRIPIPELTIQSSTITENHSEDISGGFGGIAIGGSPRIKVFVANSVIANNSNIVERADEIGTGDLTATYSHIGDKEGDIGHYSFDNSVIVNTNPMLAALANNGGDTRTHELANNSPLINAGDVNAYIAGTSIPSFDQRGSAYTRVKGDSLDIGAYEKATSTPCTNNCGGGTKGGSGGSISYLLGLLLLVRLTSKGEHQ